MRVLPYRRVIHVCIIAGFALALQGLSACAGGAQTSASGSATETTNTSTPTSSPTTTSPTTGYQPDPVPCEAKSCDLGSDCCPNGGNHPGDNCNDSFPNNWTCVNSVCVHGGCSSDDDCSFSGLKCRTVAGIGRCVAPCESDVDCGGSEGESLVNMPGTQCIGDAATTSFCLENVSPP